GHLSVGEAFRTIQRGDADLAIAGGAETLISPMGMMRRQLLGRLTSETDPAAAVRPFDETATGTVVAEGGALLILEDADHAKARGATVYAEVAGFGAAQDPHDPALPDPDGVSYSLAIKNALADAGIAAADIDAIVPHGLGIAHHDASELAGLRRVFDDLTKPTLCPIKSQTGDASAGCAIDLAAAALATHTGTLPPAMNTTRDDLNVSPEARTTSPSHVLASTFGMGGQNAAVIFRKP
ncbi:MAG: beta-ketoacyl synthase N-terminal-like domain-containing protein, partial [Planctomycetota bacterium]